eukprot:PRCOL_00002188-RA
MSAAGAGDADAGSESRERAGRATTKRARLPMRMGARFARACWRWVLGGLAGGGAALEGAWRFAGQHPEDAILSPITLAAALVARRRWLHGRHRVSFNLNGATPHILGRLGATVQRMSVDVPGDEPDLASHEHVYTFDVYNNNLSFTPSVELSLGGGMVRLDLAHRLNHQPVQVLALYAQRPDSGAVVRVGATADANWEALWDWELWHADLLLPRAAERDGAGDY